MHATWDIALIFCLSHESKARPSDMTRQEIEQKMDEPVRKYSKTHDKKELEAGGTNA
jgi:hypothetical protein